MQSEEPKSPDPCSEKLEPAGSEADEPEEQLTAGRLLREARERADMTVQDVADELHLTRHFIHALEEDRYDKLPGEVFARGYLRSYARLLDLEAEYLLSLHDQYGERRIARKEEAIKRHARRRMDKNRPWIIVSGVAFILLALALWLFSGQVDQTGPVPEDSVPGAAESDPDEMGDTLDNPFSLALPGAAPGDDLSQQTLLPESVTSRPRDSRFDVNWTGDDSLIVVALADSRVEIEDRAADHRFDELISDGSVLHLTGQAPFSLVLGDARAVELHFNGRMIDISGNVRDDNSARLTLGL